MQFPDGKFKELTAAIIGAAIEVHRHLGPGLLESSYEECLEWELTQLKLSVKRQVNVPLIYKGISLRSVYRLDLLVEKSVIVDVKSVVALLDVHHAQVVTYLRHTRLEVGLLINFNEALLRQGVRRIALTPRGNGVWEQI
ncbi:MAG TPA: GxxExxY protein [Gemmatimonadaceae bacterium]|nr:GxxExxY protein [Gemmatimonadaceae bacterium]